MFLKVITGSRDIINKHQIIHDCSTNGCTDLQSCHYVVRSNCTKQICENVGSSTHNNEEEISQGLWECLHTNNTINKQPIITFHVTAFFFIQSGVSCHAQNYDVQLTVDAANESLYVQFRSMSPLDYAKLITGL